jgi:hypothetical protein
MVFCGKEPVPSNICLEMINEFTYLGNKLSFQGETDSPQKITKYEKKHGYHKCCFETSISTKTY